jgi:uncharacterized protein YgbK (DUF1537 family)
MPLPPILVFADDLTGAAEIAGIGFAHGLTTALMLDANAEAPEAQLVVFDTNSRLLPPAEAADRVAALLSRQPAGLRKLVFKKIDSVMRGPLAAELEAALGALGRRGALLCPCNPSKGRIIRQGRYSVGGQALHRSEFARDPQYPARSDSVLALLGNSLLPAKSLSPGSVSALAERGLFVADADSAGQVQAWAECLDSGLLPAGGADFFGAFLAKLGLHPLPPVSPPRPEGAQLLLSGTLSRSSVTARNEAQRAGAPLAMAPEGIASPDITVCAKARAIWCSETEELLARHGRAIVCSSGFACDDRSVARRVRDSFSFLAWSLHGKRSFGHLLAEGGDIASGAAETLGWKQCFVQGNWAPGVVCLRPQHNSQILFTLKPGSYPWPPEIWALLGAGKDRGRESGARS